jgi:hypothetical protein
MKYSIGQVRTNFRFNQKKTKELRISFKQSSSAFADLQVGETTVEVVDSFQELGLTIQSNLKWNQHVERNDITSNHKQD